VTTMLVSYTLEKRGHWFILAFAVSCGLGSVYGFLQINESLQSVVLHD
jgi:hypothetical protein